MGESALMMVMKRRGKKKDDWVKILKFYEITVSQWKTVFMS